VEVLKFFGYSKSKKRCSHKKFAFAVKEMLGTDDVHLAGSQKTFLP